MALSAPSTPKTTFITPRKLGATRAPFVTPKSLKSSVINTPECFNTVTLETPNSALKPRRSKETFDQVTNLTVAVRIRPMNSKELACVGAANVVAVRNQDIIIRSSPTGSSAMCLDHIFQYDHVFWSCDETSPLFTNQEEVFLTIGKPLLNSAFRGYNACLFAYGQTGSGKSFSMMGQNTCEIIDIDSNEHSGITPRFCRDLFDRISKLDSDSTATVEVSYFEIYNEKIHDLLAMQTMRTALKVREHPEWGPYVVDLSVHTVKNYKELRNWLLLGNKNRATAATNMNEKSSRSHSIFSIELCLSEGSSDGARRSKVSLVDLAGSERLGTSHNSEEKIRQGVSINKSLLTLGKVISSLADQKKNQFVPYRDSVLTWLLRESLGGNSLTSMLATVTPANTHVDETLATLRYACQARSIVNRARINENPHDRLIRELKQEVHRLKALKQDYERSSLLSNSSSTQFDDSNTRDELEDLRGKLTEAEGQLQNAKMNWQQRFMESTRTQIEELAKSEKRREELESKVRVMKTKDTNVKLSPYKTNFLEELEGVLTQEKMLANNKIQNIVNWCSQNDFICTGTSTTLTIIDKAHKRQTSLLLKDINMYKNVSDFINNLKWSNFKGSASKKLDKTEVQASFNQIFQLLGNLKPADDENDLNLLFAKVNKSVQSFEAAMLTNLAKNSGPKTVTFNL